MIQKIIPYELRFVKLGTMLFFALVFFGLSFSVDMPACDYDPSISDCQNYVIQSDSSSNPIVTVKNTVYLACNPTYYEQVRSKCAAAETTCSNPCKGTVGPSCFAACVNQKIDCMKPCNNGVAVEIPAKASAPETGKCIDTCSPYRAQAPYPDCKCMEQIVPKCTNQCGSDQVQGAYPGCQCTSKTTNTCAKTCESGYTQGTYPDCECKPIEMKCQNSCPESQSQTLYPECLCISKRTEIKGRIYFTDYDSKGNLAKIPLRRIQLIFTYYPKSGGLMGGDGNSEFYAASDNDGNFAWSYPKGLDLNGTVGISVWFMNTDDRLIIAMSNVPGFAIIEPFARKIPASDAQLDNLDMEFFSAPEIASVDSLTSKGKIYANMLKAIEFKENTLGMKRANAEIVTISTSRGTLHMAEIFEKDYPGKTGTWIRESNSGFDSHSAPVNREYHEYCHHIQDEAFMESESRRELPGQDHAGYYANPSTEWGMVEGWAEFCALEMKRQYEFDTSGNYEVGDSTLNLEFNYDIDSKKIPRGSEELAIAGIMLDLRDSPSDYDGADDDFTSIPFKSVAEAYLQKRDFGDGLGIRNVRTLHDFYIALNSTQSESLHVPFMKGSSRTNLDQVFIQHNAYQDLNENGAYDDGEPAGYSGKGAQMRADLESEPGSQITVSAIGTDGKTVNNGVFAKVDVKVNGNQSYLSYSYLVPVRNNSISIPMPPERYETEVTVTAVQAGTNNFAPSAYMISSGEFYSKINPVKPIGAYSPKIATSKVSCLSNAQCILWGAGRYCTSEGKCANSRSTAESKADSGREAGTSGEGCFPALIIPALALLVFAIGNRTTIKKFKKEFF